MRRPAMLWIFVLLVAVGCATFEPVPLDEIGFRDNAVTQTEGDITVSAAVLTAEETEQAFGVKLYKDGIQPIWLRIENRGSNEYTFVPTNLDRDYFSAGEAAWKGHRLFVPNRYERVAEHFFDLSMPGRVPPDSTTEGFVHTGRDEGVKYVNVTLFRPGEILNIDLALQLPGLEADYEAIDFEKFAADNEIIELDVTNLRETLEGLPATTLGPDMETPGDPLNLVVIGSRLRTFLPFIRSGWDVTETMSGGSVWRTIRSSVLGREYRTSPVSPLFVFGRSQDLALQKTRATVDERNHLRMWLTPYRFMGQEIWLGQISRDIGVRFSKKTFVTHKIDPQVDDARAYLVQDLALSGGLARLGFVDGVGVSEVEAPRYNYTLDPYYTDGRRAVLFMAEGYVMPEDIQVLP